MLNKTQNKNFYEKRFMVYYPKINLHKINFTELSKLGGLTRDFVSKMFDKYYPNFT